MSRVKLLDLLDKENASIIWYSYNNQFLGYHGDKCKHLKEDLISNAYICLLEYKKIKKSDTNKKFLCIMLKGKKTNMKIYNKLIRDKIPQICEKNNQVCKTRILNDDEYLQELNAKMQEELKEYLQSGEIEELADLEEVLRAILDVKKVSYSDFEEIRKSKAEKRGAFKEKIFLETIEDMDE